MKRRLKVGQTRLNPMNSRLKGVNEQHKFYADVQRTYYENTLAASGITGVVYCAMRSGILCGCNGAASLLTEDGHLHASSVDRVVQNLYGPTSRVTFDANDLGDIELDLDEDDSLHQPVTEEDLMIYGGMDQSRCGCCFGNKYVGGFLLHNQGWHYAFDAQSPHRTDHKLETTDRPNAFREGTFIEFNVELPIVDAPVIARLWHKDTIVTDAAISIPELGFPGVLRVSTEQEFTHVEVTAISHHVPLDFPQIQDFLDPDQGGIIGSTTIHISSTVPVTRFSVVRESKFNRAWQITEVNPHYDNDILVYWECQARLVQQHELLNLLVR